jgi:hypothetical protein
MPFKLRTTEQLSLRRRYFSLAAISTLVLLAFLHSGHSASGQIPSSRVDLSQAVIVTATSIPVQEEKAVTMLIEEVEKRTQIRLERVTTIPVGSTRPIIAIGQAKNFGTFAATLATQLSGGAVTPEGYRIRVDASRSPATVMVAGNDLRGVMYGVGRLLRSVQFGKGSLSVSSDLRVDASPATPLRGHQLGYRPKTNSYDGWTVAMWEQYIRDLVVFGVNAIELLPPRTDDDADSPHFPLPQLRMMREMSRICDEYGIDVWIWYPALDEDYANPQTVESALKEWGEVFKVLPRINAVFVPGGDPGRTQPKLLMALLEKETAVLRRYHPRAEMWMSPQGFNREWMDEFYNILRVDQPKWLKGVVHGPQVRVSLPDLRAQVPAAYVIRCYPDITHTRQSQYPVPGWDVAYAITEGREPINPRPLGEATIFRRYRQDTVGFITYSEGCNDDVNKVVWSSLGWDPGADVAEILREYSSYFIGDRYRETFAQGLLALERNWQGPLAANGEVYSTLSQFQQMERSASPAELLNWRFQQALYRAYYDAYTRSRLLYEMELEDRAFGILRGASAGGTLAATEEAERILDQSVVARVSGEWRARVFELAEALFQSIRMQLSVDRYKAIAVGRGANLDTIDVPLNNRLWLKQRFVEIRAMPEEAARLKRIGEICNWSNPGSGGFYDDLGDVSRQPHLVEGAGFEKDPSFLQSSLVGFAYSPDWHRAWWTHAEALNDSSLKMRYRDLDRTADYRIRVVYAGDSRTTRMRLVANGSIEIHPLVKKEFPVKPVEFDIPREATRGGELLLEWTRDPGLGGNGRGCQVAEVWLIRK